MEMEIENQKCDNFWGDPPGTGNSSHGHGSHSHGHNLQYERNLNFSTVAIEDSEYGFPRKKTVRDPLSHRIIEKRRRDRMNNCLADLARLLPPSSLKKGRGRIEKTEIVELAIKHLRHLQCHPCPHTSNCEYNPVPMPRSSVKPGSNGGSSSSSISSGSGDGIGGGNENASTVIIGGGDAKSSSNANADNQFRLGFQESMDETIHFLVENEGMFSGDGVCLRLGNHLTNHCETLLRERSANSSKLGHGFQISSSRSSTFKERKTGGSLGSISSGYQPNGSSGSGSDGNCANDGDGINNSAFGSKTVFSTCASPGLISHGDTRGIRNSAVETNSVFNDYEGDQNSCSSAQLSIEILDAYSQDQEGKIGGRSQVKPPLPTIIGSHSSSNNSSSPPVSNSDEGNSAATCVSASSITSATANNNAHRYKFKNNIKQRFSKDLQTEITSFKHSHGDRTVDHDSSGTSGSGRDSSQESRRRNSQQNGNYLNSPRESSRDRDNNSPDYYSKSQSPDSENPTGSSELDLSSTRNRSPGPGQGAVPSNDANANSLEVSQTEDQSRSQSPDGVTSSNSAATNENAPMNTNIDEPGSSSKVRDPSSSTALEILEDKKPVVKDLAMFSSPVGLPILASVAGSSNLKGENLDEKSKAGKNCGLLSQGVPAFALHDKGHYIPLTIDKSIVYPFMAAMDENIQPPLHPVTISVCFVLPVDDVGAGVGCKNFGVSSDDTNSSHSSAIPVPYPVQQGQSKSPTVFGSAWHPHHHPLKIRDLSSPSNFIMNRFAQSQVINSTVFRSPPAGGGAIKSLNGPSSTSYHGHRHSHGHGSYPVSMGSDSCSSHSSAIGPHHSEANHHLYRHLSQGHGKNSGNGNGSASSHSGSGSCSGSNGDISVNFNSSNYYAAIPNTHRGSGSASSISMSSSVSGSRSQDAGSSGSGSGSGSGSASSSSPVTSRNRLHRKRSITKSPSISLGYHSWNEKTGSNGTCSAYSTDDGLGHRDSGLGESDRSGSASSSVQGALVQVPNPIGVSQLTSRTMPMHMPIPIQIPMPMEGHGHGHIHSHSHGHGHGHGHLSDDSGIHQTQNQHPHGRSSRHSSMDHQDVPHHLMSPNSSVSSSSRRESKTRGSEPLPTSFSSVKRSKKSRTEENSNLSSSGAGASVSGYGSSRKHVSSN